MAYFPACPIAPTAPKPIRIQRIKPEKASN